MQRTRNYGSTAPARGAKAELRELEARERARDIALGTFVDRMVAAPPVDLDEVRRIRHATRHP